MTEKLCHDENAAFDPLVRATATTPAGLLAKLAYLRAIAEGKEAWMLDEREGTALDLIESFAESISSIWGCGAWESRSSRRRRPKPPKTPGSGARAATPGGMPDRLVDYWRARFDWCNALGTAQRYGIADSASLTSAEKENRSGLVDIWREAVAKKLLTPAPDLAAITWKRAKLESRDFLHLPVKKEQVERAIANDVAFLAAHPTRARKGRGNE